MLRQREVLPLLVFTISILGTATTAETAYSCYFPTKCTTPDGQCGLASIRKNFTLSDTVASHRSNERRIILLPDMSVIYIQENSKTYGCSPSDCVKASLAEFLDDNISSVVTAHGICQLGE